MLVGLRVWIVALLLTLAFGLMRGGERDVVGCLKGDVGRDRSKSALVVTWEASASPRRD